MFNFQCSILKTFIIMSIKVKAIETDLSHFSDKDGKSLGFRFVLKPELALQQAYRKQGNRRGSTALWSSKGYHGSMLGGCRWGYQGMGYWRSLCGYPWTRNHAFRTPFWKCRWRERCSVKDDYFSSYRVHSFSASRLLSQSLATTRMATSSNASLLTQVR